MYKVCYGVKDVNAHVLGWFRAYQDAEVAAHAHYCAEYSHRTGVQPHICGIYTRHCAGYDIRAFEPVESRHGYICVHPQSMPFYAIYTMKLRQMPVVSARSKREKRRVEHLLYCGDSFQEKSLIGRFTSSDELQQAISDHHHRLFQIITGEVPERNGETYAWCHGYQCITIHSTNDSLVKGRLPNYYVLWEEGCS